MPESQAVIELRAEYAQALKASGNTGTFDPEIIAHKMVEACKVGNVSLAANPILKRLCKRRAITSLKALVEYCK